MAKCNLLPPLNDDRGTFYIFSEYSEDLTKERSNGSFYKVVPSEYVALELDASEKDNREIGEVFQNFFENSSAFLRSTPSTNWDVDGVANALFWETLIKNDLLGNTAQYDETASYYPSVKFWGDVEVYSNNQVEGINYNEIYINIPQAAAETHYGIEQVSPQISGTYTYENTTGYDNYIYKWSDITYPSSDGSLVLGHTPILLNGNKCGVETDVAIPIRTNSIPANSNSFTFNAVAVFYNIEKIDDDGTPTVLYHNKPLGIYITGGVTVDEEIGNPVTKFSANDNIYGQGTSYGLRLLTKYVCTQNSTLFTEAVIEHDDCYPEFCQLMDGFVSNLNQMNQIAQATQAFNQQVRDHLAQFKGRMTNVPYIRTIGGVNHWFVNGQDTGAVVPAQNDILNLLHRLESLESLINEGPDYSPTLNNLEHRLEVLESITPGGGGEGGGQIIQVEVLPEASADTLDDILQYVGPSTEILTNGYFYQCQLNEQSGNYTWAQKSVQPSSGGETGNAIWGEIIGEIEEQTDLQQELALKSHVEASETGVSEDVAEYITIDEKTYQVPHGVVHVKADDDDIMVFYDDDEPGPGGEAKWGEIKGDIKKQEDLQDELALKSHVETSEDEKPDADTIKSINVDGTEYNLPHGVVRVRADEYDVMEFFDGDEPFSPTRWGEIEGNIEDQTDLKETYLQKTDYHPGDTIEHQPDGSMLVIPGTDYDGPIEDDGNEATESISQKVDFNEYGTQYLSLPVDKNLKLNIDAAYTDINYLFISNTGTKTISVTVESVAFCGTTLDSDKVNRPKSTIKLLGNEGVELRIYITGSFASIVPGPLMQRG